MLYYQFLPALLAALAVASPTPQNKTPVKSIQLLDGTSLTVSDAVKRAPKTIQLLDGTTMTVSPATPDKRSPNEKRGDDKISSCGPKSGWTPVDNHGLHFDLAMWGYRSAVAAFCSRSAFGLNPDGTATPVVVAAGTKISYTVRWENDKPNLADNERGHRVGLKDDKPGHIEFEVNNKRDKGDYTMQETSCITYLMNMADSTKDCYGSNNKDTKGGTWQMEDNKLTFHALPAVDGDANVPHDELRI